MDSQFVDVAGLQVAQLRAGDTEFWELLSRSEYQIIKDYIGRPKRVMDLGCGLGRMAVYVNFQLGNPDIEYIFADSTGSLKKTLAGWKPKPGFYNDLELTGKYAQANGVKKYRLFDLQKESIASLTDIDIVMSFLSVGFHYPIETYFDDLCKATVPGCTMIFGVRRGMYAEAQFADKFQKVVLVPGTAETKLSGRIKEDLLILQGKK